MDDLIGIVVLILYLVAAGAAGKNKKKKKAKQRAAGSREAQFEQAFERIAQSVLSAERTQAKKAPEKAQKRAESPKITQEGTDPCHEAVLPPQRPAMGFKPVTQTAMHAAGEGEDPCHTGDAPEESVLLEESPVYRSPIFDAEDREAFAQDVLRGVIMSEVLMRPGQRRMAGGVKRGA